MHNKLTSNIASVGYYTLARECGCGGVCVGGGGGGGQGQSTFPAPVLRRWQILGKVTYQTTTNIYDMMSFNCAYPAKLPAKLHYNHIEIYQKLHCNH